MLRMHMMEKCTGAQKRKQMSRRYQPRPKLMYDDDDDATPLNLSINDSNSHSISSTNTLKKEAEDSLKFSKVSLTKVQSSTNSAVITGNHSVGHESLKPWSENGCDISTRVSPSGDSPRNSIQYTQTNDSSKEIPKYRKPHKHTIESLLEEEKPHQKLDSYPHSPDVPQKFDSYAVSTDHNKKLTVILQKITPRDDSRNLMKEPEVVNSLAVPLIGPTSIPLDETKTSRYETRGHNRKMIHPILYFSDSDDDEFPPVWNSRRGKKRKKRSLPKPTGIKKRPSILKIGRAHV